MNPRENGLEISDRFLIMNLQVNFIKGLRGQHVLNKRIQTGVTPYLSNLISHSFGDRIKS